MQNTATLHQALLAAFPLVAVAPDGAVPPADADGIRYLVSATGLWRQVTLPWVTFVHEVAPAVLRLPYGQVQPTLELRCSGIPTDLIREFTARAKQQAPTEVAAAFLWDEGSDTWRLAWRHARSASSGHIEYDEVRPLDGEHLVLDAHSHGYHPAFFSAEDDRDDHGSMKFSLVVGSLNQALPSSAMRLCMAGVQLPARIGAGGCLEVLLEGETA